MSTRKAAWSFSAVWTFPGHTIASSSFDQSILHCEIRQMETELKRLVLDQLRFPLVLRNVELIYKLSDWECRPKHPNICRFKDTSRQTTTLL
jgi:hypothetical protein